MESASVIKDMEMGLVTKREEEHPVDQQLKGISLFLGGARSGKSAYALQLAEQSRQKITYLATAGATDSEMEMRIDAHKASRSALWETWEGEPRQLPGIIAQTEVGRDRQPDLLQHYVQKDDPCRVTLQGFTELGDFHRSPDDSEGVLVSLQLTITTLVGDIGSRHPEAGA